ncbi:Uncharacterized protein BM_BM3686 [Brugia malayi]|uniref:BMA-PSR-1 n=1 Tax=Brugia malayi TaxID=6279 RepID=A0A0K0JBE0_BRUMA|nr:Uncharacterized protein BM_BM3686 [Brugia malayi]CRZ25824.1 BMA-PSR-1 [Brugia malayi]VIO86352.1 Uncharacterized protein BM_BM3686 [Brugia malayi]
MSVSQYRLQRCILHAKHKARSELLEEDWSSAKYCETFETLSEKLTGDNIERVDASKITVEEFAEKYEYVMYLLFLLMLLKKYRNQRFKCGEGDDGRSVKLKMKYFLEYMRQTVDDSPLYIFDSTFGENALVKGSKKWCFFHPQTPKNILKPTKKEGGIHPNEAITWFTTVYGRISSPNWLKQWRPIEAVQYPGEVIFVPGGWWHVVLNLTDTVAFTQNFCSRVNLLLVLLKTLAGRPKFCQHWLKCLRKARPDILPIIDGVLKNVDGFINFAESSSNDSSSSTESSDSESESPNPPLQQYPFSMKSATITKRGAWKQQRGKIMPHERSGKESNFKYKLDANTASMDFYFMINIQ